MKNAKHNILSLAVLGVLASCGGGSGGSGGSGSSTPGRTGVTEALAVDGSNIQGLYRADFVTLNPHVNGTIPGGVTFKRDEDKLYAYSRVFAGGPQVWHQQHVYMGNRCPTMSDDTNQDGYIDINEANAVLGNVIIPLDSDLGTQSSGRRFFPLADLSGGYAYERITSFKRFFDDLKGPDKDPLDNMIKLAENEGFTFEGKAVMIQGVSETLQFPTTVGSTNRLRVFQTLPIACGIFGKNQVTPGTELIDDGAIPGPVAPVIEGQDVPAPEGAGEYYPPEPGNNTGAGSNRTGEGETGEGTETPEDFGT